MLEFRDISSHFTKEGWNLNSKNLIYNRSGKRILFRKIWKTLNQRMSVNLKGYKAQ